MDTLKSRQPPHTCRVTDAFGSALIFGRYSSSSAWQALSEAESPGPPEAPAVYLQRHSRATFSKETPVSPMSAIRTARVRRAVEGTSRDGEEEKRASMSVRTSEASVEARGRELQEGVLERMESINIVCLYMNDLGPTTANGQCTSTA